VAILEADKDLTMINRCGRQRMATADPRPMALLEKLHLLADVGHATLQGVSGEASHNPKASE